MKKRFLLIAFFSLFLVGCSSQVGGSSSYSSSSSSESSSSSSEVSSSSSESSSSGSESGVVKDTSGNTITSGSSTVSFSGTSVSINAAYLIDGVTVEITSGTYASSSSSSNQTIFLVVNGGSLKITGNESSLVNLTKTGSAASSGQVSDEYNFYGINSGIVVSGSKSNATISYALINTASNGSNAIVSTNSATVTISNLTITTSGNAGSRGLHATYSGNIVASSTFISTTGASCASLATDRGGGTITASNMTLSTAGAGSPLVYSTGTISVTSSSGSASGAQIVVVEGGSKANLTSCTFSCTGTGNRTGTSESNSSSHVVDACGIFIYQSMSGDAESGTDYFTASNCTLTVTTSGIPMIFSTNITANITLNNNTFVQGSSSDYFIVGEQTSAWGTSGSNGATMTLAITSQPLNTYKAYVGSTSSLKVTATDSSSTSISITNA